VFHAQGISLPTLEKHIMMCRENQGSAPFKMLIQSARQKFLPCVVEIGERLIHDPKFSGRSQVPR